MSSPSTPRAARSRSRVLRHLSVGAVSALIVASAVLYAVSPAVQTISARVVAVRAVRPGAERIIGQALENGKPTTEVIVSVYRIAGDRRILFASQQVDADGRFALPLPPGPYIVVFTQRGQTATVAVHLRPRRTIFIAVTVKSGGGFVGVPVIFNY